MALAVRISSSNESCRRERRRVRGAKVPRGEKASHLLNARPRSSHVEWMQGVWERRIGGGRVSWERRVSVARA